MNKEMSEVLVRVGPDTPMGRLMRRYWVPVLSSWEIPEPDCPQVRVKILGEKLLAYRDSQGRAALIDEFCAHRGVSLFFARNEENGIRCSYHGWKFDLSGQCVELPSVPDLAPKMRIKAYPCVERGGLVWAYMGPPDKQPAPPELEWCAVPESHRYVSKRLQECSWLQAMEGGIDSSHVSWLHKGDLHADKLHRATKGAAYQADVAPKFEVVESEGGLLIGARRNAEPGEYYWRITQWIMPWYTMVPPYGDNALNGHAWVPIDDENCLAWSFTYHPTRPLSDEEIEVMSQGGGIHVKYMPGTFRPLINKDNDYMIDRAAQKAGRTFSGVESIAMQDASVQESMGPISDRTRENLVSTDNAIIMARFRLRKAALDLQNGIEPPGTKPSCHAVRSAAFVLPADKPFQSERAEALVSRDGVAHTSI